MNADDSDAGNIEMQEAERTILQFAKAFGLERDGIEIEGIQIGFERIESPKSVLCDLMFDEREVLVIKLRERSLQDGVKLSVAKLATNADTAEELPLFKGYFVGFLYPIGVLALSLGLIFTVLPADPIITLLAGPILFSVLVLPPELSLVLLGRRRMAVKRRSIMRRLRSTGLYSDDAEISRYAGMYLGGQTTFHALAFSMYVIGMLFLLAAVAQAFAQ